MVIKEENSPDQCHAQCQKHTIWWRSMLQNEILHYTTSVQVYLQKQCHLMEMWNNHNHLPLEC